MTSGEYSELSRETGLNSGWNLTLSRLPVCGWINVLMQRRLLG